MQRIGEVFIQDFDLGVLLTLGATLVPVRTLDGERSEYAVQIDGVTGPPEFLGRVPIYIVVGSLSFQPKYLPAMIVRRSGMDPATVRGQPFSIAYDIPVSSDEDGPLTREMRAVADPYDLTYEVKVESRGPAAQREVNLLTKHVMRRCRAPGFALRFVRDTEGHDRSYDAIVETTTPNVSVLDLVARDVSWSLTFRVVGELDLALPQVTQAVRQPPVIRSSFVDGGEEV